MYQVYEHNQRCGDLAKLIQLDKSWHNDTFETFEEAQTYATAWVCGNIEAPDMVREILWEEFKKGKLNLKVNEPLFVNGVYITVWEIPNA